MTKNLLPALLLLFTTSFVTAQNFTGQWKGTFLDKSTSFTGWGGDRCDYVLELEANGNDVTGYSYTYFTDGGKKYYTICSLKGTINKREKYIEIRETVRTKTNVPNNIKNCFQIHKLTYFKKEDSESLEGNWVPAPDQAGDCGYGTTSLQRRLLKKSFPSYNNTTAKKAPVKTGTNKAAPVAKKTTPVASKPAKPLANKVTNSKPVAKNNTVKPLVKATPKKKEMALIPKEEVLQNPVEMPLTKKNIDDKIIAPSASFEKRNNTIIKTIEVENISVKVDLYDNGEVDGDSISLFYNSKLLLSHKRLSEKPISLNITVENDKSINELVMYAENLGSIPPNTALMIVTDGPNRYEVRITSDLQKSGAIRFIHKQPPN